MPSPSAPATASMSTAAFTFGGCKTGSRRRFVLGPHPFDAIRPALFSFRAKDFLGGSKLGEIRLLETPTLHCRAFPYHFLVLPGLTTVGAEANESRVPG